MCALRYVFTSVSDAPDRLSHQPPTQNRTGIAMDAATLIRVQFAFMHDVVRQMMTNLTPEQLHHRPAGRAMSIAANWAHMVYGEDVMLALASGDTALAHGAWRDRTGISELDVPGTDMAAWATRVTLDLELGRDYAQAVHDEALDYISTLRPRDINRTVDPSVFGLPPQPLGTFLHHMIADTHWHTGEIAAIKGVQGLRGYPF